MEGEKKGVPAWVWIVALVPVAVFMLGIGSALAIYGVRKYMVNAKQEEEALAETKSAAASAEAVPSPLGVPAEGVMLAPPPPMTPLAALQGEPADLSSVMGRARKLANQWQADAALLGIEASTIVGARIQTQEGGSAKLTFGPTSFNVAEPRAGVFIVIYDKAGISGAPGKAAALPELPEPMCAPEFVYRRAAGEGQSPAISLRYAMDQDRRPVWLAQLTGDSKAKPMAFDPQNCQAAAIRQRH